MFASPNGDPDPVDKSNRHKSSSSRSRNRDVSNGGDDMTFYTPSFIIYFFLLYTPIMYHHFLSNLPFLPSPWIHD